MEVGGGTRQVKYGMIALIVLALALCYNWRGYKNMSNPEAMDAAQLARNIAGHKGYTTLFIRPLSIYLVQKTADDKLGPPAVRDVTDRAQLKGMHPDLANPPVYPLALAALMKTLPFHYPVAGQKSFWNRFEGDAFWWYQPDFLISLFNQVLFLITVGIVFLLARRLFDSGVAWVSSVVLLGTDLFWRFSVSGLSTMLLLLIFMAVVCCLVALEQGAREGGPARLRLAGLAALIGVLAGLGCLTRYAFGWIIIPLLLFLVLFLGKQRLILCLTAFAAFAAVLSPWLVRNYRVSHTLFGTAGYALYETAGSFAENRLERSLKPDFSQFSYLSLRHKLVANTQAILEDDLPKMTGNWVGAFFLVGLLVRFNSPTLSRLRYFLLLCLLVFIVVQALGRTQLSADYPVINSENLLVLLAPLVILFGVSLFFLLLEQVQLPFVSWRFGVIGLFCGVGCLPMIFALLGPRAAPVAYPPYFPPIIQQSSRWLKEKELVMSDIPWAVAWYGQRQCVWLTLTVQDDHGGQDDFFAINDYLKPVSALYLIPQTLNTRLLPQWARPGSHSWGSFVLECLVNQQVPPYFPLKKAPIGFWPEQIFLTDTERWKISQPALSKSAP